MALGLAGSFGIELPVNFKQPYLAKNISKYSDCFVVSGIWHGAGLTFVIWGLLYGILQVIEKCFVKKF